MRMNRFGAACLTADSCPSAGDKGQVREAVTFDGNDVLTLNNTGDLSLIDFSAGMWIKPTKTFNPPQ